MFLLDTNILSDARKPRLPLALKTWLRCQEEVAIPFPAILEIEQGIAEIRRTQPEKADELREWLDSVLAARHHYPAVTPAVARLLAEMYCCRPLKNLWYTQAAKKEKKPGQDLFVAAIAIIHSLPIATTDVFDFVLIDHHFRIPGVYSPTIGEWAVPPPATTIEKYLVAVTDQSSLKEHAVLSLGAL